MDKNRLRESLTARDEISALQKRLSDYVKAISIREEKIEITYVISAGTEILLTLDLDDFRAAPFTSYVEGSYEPFLSKILLELAARSDVFWDIGANVGFHSIAAGKHNDSLLVFSFEPNQSVAGKLMRHAVMNGIQNRISLNEFGIGLSTRLVELYVPSQTGSGGGSLINLHPDEEAHEFRVEIRALSDIPITPRPGLIKIDVEGSEWEVIRALEPIIDETNPSIIVELLRKWMAPFGSHPQDVVSFLLAKGYRCFGIGESCLRRLEEIDDDTVETNFLFVHPIRESKVGEELAKISNNQPC